MTCPSRSFSERVLRTTAWTAILLAGTAYSQVAGRYAGAPPPVTSMSAPGTGSVEGYVYWDTRAVTHNPAGTCNGFSVTVIAGGHALTSGQFGAKYVGQVKSFLAGGTVVAYDVCTYAYDHVQENTPLSVQLAITQPSAFTGNVAPANPLSGPITIINGQCNMLPAATPGAGDLAARPGSCQNMAFDVNFQLVPASGSSRASTLPRTGTALSPGNSGPLLTTGAQPTLLGNAGPTSAATRPAAQPMITGGTTPAPGGLTPLARSNTGAGGAGSPSGGLQPLMPRNSLSGGSKTGLSGGSNKPLTNQDVLSLLSAGISEQNILTKIRSSASSFDVSNQGRASFDAQCAAIKPPGVSSGAWGTEISGIWQTMNNVAICQQTNGRGGEGACDATAPQAMLNNASGSTPPVPSKPAGRNQYEAITTQRGVTQDPTFSKFAGGGTAATNSGINNGTKKADDLNPQPYPPKGTVAVGGGTAPAVVPMSSPSLTGGGTAAKLSLPPNLQVFTVGEAKNPAALNLVRGPQLTANGGGMLGPGQTMSAGGGNNLIGSPSAAASAITGRPAAGGPAAMQPGTNAGSRGVLSSAVAKAPCMSSGVAAVNGARFTQFTPGTHYTITGCGFGSAPGKVYLTGPFAEHNGRIDLGPYWQYPATRTWTGHWSDQVIDAQLDQALSGELDQDNVVLVVETSTGQQIQMNNVSFRAQRAEIMLGSIPLSAIAPDPHNTFGLAVSPCTSSWVTGHCTVDVLREIGAKMNSNPPDVYTIHLKTGFVLSRATLLVMDQTKVTSWTTPQISNGNQIVIDWQWSTYQSLSYSLYGLQIYVIGPLGVTDAWVGQ